MGNYQEKWLSDLSEGQKGERIVAEFLSNRFGLEDVSYNNDSDYDFKGRKDDREVLFEVKTDRYEYFKGETTYNMFIEITCSGKPSGILTSKADTFIYFYPDLEKMYIIPMSELRMLCIKEDIKLTSMSGDGGRTEGYLVHRNLWKDKFKVYNIKKENNLWKEKTSK